MKFVYAFQGGELLHSTIAKIERRTNAIRDHKKRLKAIWQAHYASNSHKLRAKFPKKEKRGPYKKKRGMFPLKNMTV